MDVTASAASIKGDGVGEHRFQKRDGVATKNKEDM
jgi:hypothetical protein